MAQGYYKDPDATSAAFTDDGWFRTVTNAIYRNWNSNNATTTTSMSRIRSRAPSTPPQGDIGEMNGTRITVIDRKKNIFKLAQGAFLSVCLCVVSCVSCGHVAFVVVGCS